MSMVAYNQNYRAINSIVNNVSILLDVTSGSNHGYIKKQFLTEAKQTGIELPVARIHCEKRLIEWVSKRLIPSNLVKVPTLINFDYRFSTICYSALPVNNLKNTFSTDWPKEEYFIELMDFINELAKVDSHEIISIFSGIQEDSEICRQRLMGYKFGVSNPVTGNFPIGLCLGDVSTSNMLFWNNALYIYDFEFGHIGILGYDQAQLVASVELQNSKIARKLEKHALQSQGYHKWLQLFREYYHKKEK